MANTPVINNFNAGELSPFLYARNDLKKYNSGCLTLENFQALPYGGAVRRPAIKFITEAKDNDDIALIEFEFSSEQTYVLEFGNLYIRFMKDGGILPVGGPAYEIVSPYAIADVKDLRVVQSADVMWIVHPNYPVYKLSRFGDVNWTIVEETSVFPVFRDQNSDATTLDCDQLTGTGATLTASTNTFDANHVGSYWELKHIRTKTAIEATVDESGTEPPVPTSPLTVANSIIVPAGVDAGFITHGNFVAGDKLAIWRSFDDGVTWEQFRYYSMEGRNVDTSWTGDNEDAIYTITSDAAISGSFALSVNEAFDTGVVKVTAFTSATAVTVDVIRDLGSVATTTKWSEGAWSTFRGFPQAIALWESRLIFAGNTSQPNTLWLSTIDDFNNFNQTTLDDAAMTVTIGSGRLDEIRWIVPQRALIIGTAGSEWALEAESDNKPVTPSSFSLQRKTTYGSTSKVQGVLVNSAILFVMRQGRKVREFVFNFDSQDYVAPDLTVLAEHITEGGIIGSAYQQQPDNNLLSIRADGTMIPMTYERDQDVTGWQRWTNDEFTFESVAILPRDNDEDAVYVSCKLTVDGNTKRYIGIMDNREWGTNIATEWNGSDFYTATTLTDIGDDTITGLTYLEGKTVDIVRDGMVDPQQVVTGGQITVSKPFSPPITVSGTSTSADGVYSQGIDEAGKVSYVKDGYWIKWDGATDWLITETVGSTTLFSVTDSDTNPPETGWSGGALLAYTATSRIVIGLPYTSTMAPLFIEPQSQFVQPMGKHKSVRQAVIRFKDTIHARVGQTLDKLETVSFRSTTDDLDQQVALFNGEKKVRFDNQYDLLHTCYVVQDKPLPMTVIAMIPLVGVS